MSFPITQDDLWSAWERVQENEGCAGSDGVTVEQFSRHAPRLLARLLERVAEHRYRPFPLLKIVVEKRFGSDGRRTLLVPSVGDRVLETAVARYLSRSFEEEFLECSFGYRPGRSVDRAIARIRKCREMGYCFVVDADIEAFFDRVDHALLLARLADRRPPADIMDLLRQWVERHVWDGAHLRRLRRGVPQGSPISPLLANFFLEDFDRELEKSGRKLIRYADDFLILAKTREDAQQALVQAETLLAAAHLDLNREKTSIVDFETGFNFLGALFEGEGIWVPWKNERPKGRLLFMARPLPLSLKQHYELTAPRSSMQAAFARAEATGLAPAAIPANQPANQARSKPVAFLYLTKQGSILRKAGDRLLVEKEDEVILDIPYHKLESVLLFGSVQVTGQTVPRALPFAES